MSTNEPKQPECEAHMPGCCESIFTISRLVRRLEKAEQRVLEVEAFGLNRMTELQKLHTENATLRAALESAPPNYYGWDQDASRDEYNQWLVIRAKALEPKK